MVLPVSSSACVASGTCWVPLERPDTDRPRRGPQRGRRAGGSLRLPEGACPSRVLGKALRRRSGGRGGVPPRASLRTRCHPGSQGAGKQRQLCDRRSRPLWPPPRPQGCPQTEGKDGVGCLQPAREPTLWGGLCPRQCARSPAAPLHLSNGQIASEDTEAGTGGSLVGSMAPPRGSAGRGGWVLYNHLLSCEKVRNSEAAGLGTRHGFTTNRCRSSRPFTRQT